MVLGHSGCGGGSEDCFNGDQTNHFTTGIFRCILVASGCGDMVVVMVVVAVVWYCGVVVVVVAMTTVVRVISLIIL